MIAILFVILYHIVIFNANLEEKDTDCRGKEGDGQWPSPSLEVARYLKNPDVLKGSAMTAKSNCR